MVLASKVLTSLPLNLHKMTRGTEFLNAYEIANLSDLRWLVSIYTVKRLDGYDPNHGDRGKNKDIIWQLRAKYKGQCPGYGFVIDVDKTTIAIPSAWDIPDQENFEGYHITCKQKLEACAANLENKIIVSGILRETIKRRFKDELSQEIGPVWQDYGDFCQSSIVNAIGHEIAFGGMSNSV